jgi:DNA-binding MarR family transcriptional regulator
VTTGHSKLAVELGKQTPFDSKPQEAFLNLVRTHELLSGQIDALLKTFGLSQPQYNVLRVLRGHETRGEAATPVGTVQRELVSRSADVTRLVDRLVTMGHVTRERSSGDRRVVEVGLTEGARALLAQIDEPLLALHVAQFAHMDPDQVEQLNTLLAQVRPSESSNETHTHSDTTTNSQTQKGPL